MASRPHGGRPEGIALVSLSWRLVIIVGEGVRWTEIALVLEERFAAMVVAGLIVAVCNAVQGSRTRAPLKP